MNPPIIFSINLYSNKSEKTLKIFCLPSQKLKWHLPNVRRCVHLRRLLEFNGKRHFQNGQVEVKRQRTWCPCLTKVNAL